MTTKERKQIKHSLKTNIDNADLYIRLALRAEEQGNVKGCIYNQHVSYELEKAKKEISELTNKVLTEIDNAIQKLS